MIFRVRRVEEVVLGPDEPVVDALERPEDEKIWKRFKINCVDKHFPHFKLKKRGSMLYKCI